MWCQGGVQSTFYYKEASGSCDDSGWTCIADLNSTTLSPYSISWGPLDSGTTYFLMTDGFYYGGWFRKFFTLNCLTTSVFDLPENSRSGKFSIYSNSSSHNYSIVAGDFLSESNLAIYTMTGACVFKSALTKENMSFYFDAPAGVYLVMLSDDGGEWVQKLIVVDN